MMFYACALLAMQRANISVVIVRMSKSNNVGGHSMKNNSSDTCIDVTPSSPMGITLANLTTENSENSQQYFDWNEEIQVSLNEIKLKQLYDLIFRESF